MPVAEFSVPYSKATPPEVPAQYVPAVSRTSILPPLSMSVFCATPPASTVMIPPFLISAISDFAPPLITIVPPLATTAPISIAVSSTFRIPPVFTCVSRTMALFRTYIFPPLLTEVSAAVAFAPLTIISVFAFSVADVTLPLPPTTREAIASS